MRGDKGRNCYNLPYVGTVSTIVILYRTFLLLAVMSLPFLNHCLVSRSVGTSFVPAKAVTS